MKMFLPIAFALAAATPPASNFARPTDMALQDSLNDLEVCRSLNPSECWSPKRAYKVHGASCIPIAPESGKPTIACRVDSTITYEDPKRGYTRDHDWCARLSKRGKLDGRPEWEVLQIRDRPCEIRSMLTSDPNPTPGQAPIERALLGMLTCYDLDGQTECGSQPESASLQAFQCTQIQPGEEYTVRVACRVTGDVRYSTGRLMSQFSHACVRFDRVTPADRSPAIWVGIYVPEKSPCEVR
jgi:hypothetical protein